MVKLSACIEMIFSEEPDFAARIGKVATLGIPAIEFWSWAGKDLDRIRQESDRHGVKIAAMCVDYSPEFPDQWPRGVMVDPQHQQVWQSGVRASLEAARGIGCASLIATVGNSQPHLSDEQQIGSIVTNLTAVAPLAEQAGVTIVIEPLNIYVDHKGYFLWSSSLAFDIVRRVGSPRVKVLFDCYHQQIMEGNLIANIRKNIDLIGHFHSADVPGRHEFGTGELNYANIMKAIGQTGYDGYFGMEYKPAKPSAETLLPALEMARATG